MIKPTPNPRTSTSPYESFDSKKLHAAAERAPTRHPQTQGDLFIVSPDIDTETLLANASEDLLSISAIAADLADT